MSTVHLMPLRTERHVETPVVGRLVVLASLCMALQVVSTDLGTIGQAPIVKAVWLAAGLSCLWLLHAHHSFVARALVLVAAVLPALHIGFAASVDPDQALMGLACLAQAILLMTPPVRAHVSA